MTRHSKRRGATGLRCLVLALVVPACIVDERVAVVRTAAGAETPWTCPEEQTRVTEVEYGRYRLKGCGQSAIYECNFAFQPPRCWK